MVATVPVNNEIKRLVRDAYDNLVDQGSDDAFARRRRRAWTVPSPFEIGAERNSLRRSSSLKDASGMEASASRSSSSARAAINRSFQRRSSSLATSRLSGQRRHTAGGPALSRNAPARAPVRPDDASLRSRDCGLHCRERGFYAKWLYPGDHFLRGLIDTQPPNEMQALPPWFIWLPRQWYGRRYRSCRCRRHEVCGRNGRSGTTLQDTPRRVGSHLDS